MRKYITLLFSIVLLASANDVCAQQYYTPGQDIAGNGFVYKCIYKGNIEIYNANNVLTDAVQTRKNGNPIIYNVPLNAQPRNILHEPSIYLTLVDIFNSVLTASDKDKLRADFLGLIMYINSDTGKVMEVHYFFHPARDGFVHIAPEKYFAIEQKIKQRMSFIVTAEGKTLNFNMYTMPVRGRDLQ